MKRISIVFVAALAVAAVGCKKKGADCDKAISNSLAVSKASMPGVDDAMLAKMKDLGVQHCKEDKWSDDVVKCMIDAKSQADAQACYGKMPADQRDKMNKAAMELMTPPGGAGAAAAGSAAGSDMGAAGAGSAAGSDTAPGSAAGGSAAAGSAAGGSGAK
jgi:hypothetical protein